GGRTCAGGLRRCPGGARGRSTTTENTDRQVFWLSAPDGRGPPSRGGQAPVALDCPRAWPITAAAPRRIRTGFPLHHRPESRVGGPVVTGEMIATPARRVEQKSKPGDGRAGSR